MEDGRSDLIPRRDSLHGQNQKMTCLLSRDGRWETAPKNIPFLWILSGRFTENEKERNTDYLKNVIVDPNHILCKARMRGFARGHGLTRTLSEDDSLLEQQNLKDVGQ